MFEHLLPANVSTYGGDIDSVFWLIFWIVGVWFVAAEGILFYSIVRYRRRQGVAASYDRGATTRQAAWVLVPAAIVLVLDLGIDSAGHRAWNLEKGTPPPAQVQVHASAKQFNWSFAYPGKDGKFGTAGGFSVDNDLHVPVGAVIHLELASEDVIHSFFVPNLRLKQDVVPGRKIKAWFEATAPGTYEIACSELCGFGHYTMRGTVVVQTAKDYEQWLHDNAPATAAAEEPVAAAN